MPKISVLMAVHNGTPYLSEALESIFTQTFKDFEFIVVDDDSSDGSMQLLRGIRDTRLRLIANKRQLGLSRSLNKGLAIAKGKYIARMDADDISLPKRLAAQYSFLETHSNIDVLGTWTKTLGLRSDRVWRYPTDDAEIRAELLFNSVLVHSTIMLRRSTFAKYKFRYDTNVTRAQDYELWVRTSNHLRFANLGTVLHRYRTHDQQVGEQHGAEQRAVAARVRVRQIVALGLQPNKAELRVHNAISQWHFPSSRAGLLATERWLLEIGAANQRWTRYDQVTLDKVLERRWWAACRAAVNLGRLVWDLYKNSTLAKKGKRSSVDKVIFWSKALLREVVEQ